MTLTAVLFAGGLSTRMGLDKALLQFQGQPLWLRQVQLLSQMQPQALWISARSRPAWCPESIEVVCDVEPSRGPLSGLAETLGRLQTSHLLALAVDLPQMTIQPLLKLRDLIAPGCGAVPFADGHFEPLAAIYPVEAASVAARALERGELSLQAFVRQLQREQRVQAYPLSADELKCFANANTPADLERCLQAPAES
ncbi:MAG: molybdenum cofactor guanylyltransferase [Verrucomicrobiota bacterium]